MSDIQRIAMRETMGACQHLGCGGQLMIAASPNIAPVIECQKCGYAYELTLSSPLPGKGL